MINTSERFCLKWNDFQENITNYYLDLRKDQEFSDVTLICENEQHVKAHKMILNASSPFFSTVFKMNNHPHPMIYMRGIKVKDLEAIMDFIYQGEANINQEDLDGFLALAEDLQLKGLSGTKESNEDDSKTKQQPIIEGLFFKQEYPPQPPIHLGDNIVTTSKAKNHLIVPVDASNTLIATSDSKENMKTKLDSMIESVDGTDNMLKCTVCRKETRGMKARTILRKHIETHIEGLSYPCNQCDTVSRTSNASQVHGFRNHRK